MNELVELKFNGKEVRTIVDENNEIWFIAKDVCTVLGIKNSRDALNRLTKTEKDDVGITDSIGRKQRMSTVCESGLYKLIFQSRKKEAIKFQTWVTSEVLPSIRKTGRYEHPKVICEKEEQPLVDLSDEKSWRRYMPVTGEIVDGLLGVLNYFDSVSEMGRAMGIPMRTMHSIFNAECRRMYYSSWERLQKGLKRVEKHCRESGEVKRLTMQVEREKLLRIKAELNAETVANDAKLAKLNDKPEI